MLAAGLSPIELMRSWDSSQDGILSKREFLHMMKIIVDDEVVWYNCVRETVLSTFKQITKDGDRYIDIVELQGWLQKGFLSLQHREKNSRRVPAGSLPADEGGCAEDDGVGARVCGGDRT